MSLVYIEPSVVALLQGNDARKVDAIAVHAVEPLTNDHRALELARCSFSSASGHQDRYEGTPWRSRA